MASAALPTAALPTAALAKPPGYDGVSCSPGGVDVCQYNSVTERWLCDTASIVDPGLATGGATAWMINGVHSSCDDMTAECSNICDGAAYCAFGQIPVTGGTTKFFCILDGSDADYMREGVLIGTTAMDQLSLWWKSDTGDQECWMRNEDDDGMVEGLLEGNEGNDSLYGSWEDSPDDYRDILRGGDQDDSIMSYAGNDHIFAGAGEDIAHAGAGDDLVHGESQSDALNGGNHTDDERGGSSDDLVCGGDGNDDAMFGESGVDDLKDTAGTNDFGNGGPDADECEVDVAHASCDTTGTVHRTCPTEVRLYP